MMAELAQFDDDDDLFEGKDILKNDPNIEIETVVQNEYENDCYNNEIEENKNEIKEDKKEEIKEDNKNEIKEEICKEDKEDKKEDIKNEGKENNKDINGNELQYFSQPAPI